MEPLTDLTTVDGLVKDPAISGARDLARVQAFRKARRGYLALRRAMNLLADGRSDRASSPAVSIGSDFWSGSQCRLDRFVSRPEINAAG